MLRVRGDEGYRKFRGALLEGRMTPGQTLTQSDLCEMLGLSLSPLRDTLTLLEADGLITVRKRAGIRVFEPDINFIRQNFQFRTLIEREAVPAFVDAVEDAWLDDMHDRHGALASALDDREAMARTETAMRELDQALHGTIVGALRNPMIDAAHQGLTENLKLARVLNHEVASPTRLRDAVREHFAVLAAARARDAAATLAALEAHFSASIHRVFR
jgi:DNA-binding GntR family transcriptional regulator